MTFADPQALEKLEAMSGSDFDELTFGLVQMTLAGTVTAYNRFESEMADIPQDRVIGQHFFREVAPCTNNYMVAGMYDMEAGLDATISYIFTLRMRPTQVNLRLLKGPTAGSQYLLVERV